MSFILVIFLLLLSYFTSLQRRTCYHISIQVTVYIVTTINVERFLNSLVLGLSSSHLPWFLIPEESNGLGSYAEILETLFGEPDNSTFCSSQLVSVHWISKIGVTENILKCTFHLRFFYLSIKSRIASVHNQGIAVWLFINILFQKIS